MTQFLRDYGLIAILIAGSLGGYFLLGEEREDILASSLDSIGQRLTELVDGNDAKAKTADSFAAFKEAVASNEIAPEDVERIAASVLNLRASGAALSLEDVEMVLDVSDEGGVNALPVPQGTGREATPSVEGKRIPPGPKTAAYAWSSESSRRVGSRVAAMVEFSNQIDKMSAEDAEKFGKHVQFVVTDGLQVVVDSVFTPMWQKAEMREITRDLERDQVVIWEENLAESRHVRAEQLSSQRDKINRAKNSADYMPPSEMETIRVMEKLNRLQELGVILKSDSSLVHVRLDLILKDALMQLEREIESAVQEGTIEQDESSS